MRIKNIMSTTAVQLRAIRRICRSSNVSNIRKLQFSTNIACPSDVKVDVDRHNVTRRGIQQLVDRGLVQSTFPSTILDENKRILTVVDKVKPIVYAGFDPTADSLHIGNLISVKCLLHLSASGFKVRLIKTSILVSRNYKK